MLPHWPKIEKLPSFMGNAGRVGFTTPRITVNGASTILKVASWIIERMCCGIDPSSTYCLSLWALCSVSMSQHLKMSINRESTESQQSVNRASTKHYQSLYDFEYCIFDISTAVHSHWPILEMLPIVIAITVRVTITTSKVNVCSASTERQQLRVLCVLSSISCRTGFTHTQSLCRLDWQYG